MGLHCKPLRYAFYCRIYPNTFLKGLHIPNYPIATTATNYFPNFSDTSKSPPDERQNVFVQS